MTTWLKKVTGYCQAMLIRAGFYLILLAAVSSPLWISATLFAGTRAYNSAVVAKPRLNEVKWAHRFQNINEEIKSHNESTDVLFLGDSITEGWRFTSAWAKYFNFTAFNAGIESDRTQHVLWRVNQGLVAKLKPRLVVLLVGTNNTLSNSPAQIIDGIKAICSAIKKQSSDTKILLLAILPSGHEPSAQRRIANSEANRLLKVFADSSGYQFLDLAHIFVDENGYISKEIMPDYLHPSRKAYDLWAKTMTPIINKIIR